MMWEGWAFKQLFQFEINVKKISDGDSIRFNIPWFAACVSEGKKIIGADWVELSNCHRKEANWLERGLNSSHPQIIWNFKHNSLLYLFLTPKATCTISNSPKLNTPADCNGIYTRV